MRTLYHLWLCPYARKVRIVLAEKKLPFELELEKVWDRRDALAATQPPISRGTKSTRSGQKVTTRRAATSGM